MYCYRLFFLAVVALSLFSGATARMNSSSHFMRRAIKTPENDDFYLPPDGWQSKEPGTILKTRKVNIANSGIAKYGVKGYQLLYRTSGVVPEVPSWTATTILIPEDYDNDKLVVANVYEDSFSSDCAPSYSLRVGSKVFQNVAIAYQELFFTTLLHHGWVVTVPDHEGPDNAFTSGRFEGHMVLDAIRATLGSDKVDLKKKTKVVGYGYSGGALATAWAAGLQNKYAPELNTVGWSMGGTITNLKEWLEYIDNTTGSGFALASLGGLSATYSELAWVQDALTRKGRKLFKSAKKHCMYENLISVGKQKIFSDRVFDGGSDFLDNRDVVSILNKMNVGRFPKFTPSAPVFMYHAKHDEVVPYNMALGAANAWCDQGADVRFLSVTGWEMAHTNTELFSMPYVVKFMRERFNGKDFGKSCQYPSVSNPEWDIDVLGHSLAYFMQQLLDLAGSRIGKKDGIFWDQIENGNAP